jgi:hypothetical protein
MEIRGCAGVELKSPCQRIDHLGRRMRVAPLLESQVVVGADARQHRQLLAAQPCNPAPRAANQPDVLGLYLLAPRAEVITQGIGPHRHQASLILTLRFSTAIPACGEAARRGSQAASFDHYARYAALVLLRTSMAFTLLANAFPNEPLATVPSRAESTRPLKFLPSRTMTTSTSVVPSGRRVKV